MTTLNTGIDVIQIGNRVRSFDFYSRDLDGPAACYVEGTLIAITDPALPGEQFRDCARYVINVDRQIFAGGERTGDTSLVGEQVYPPVNGTLTAFGERTDAVVLA